MPSDRRNEAAHQGTLIGIGIIEVLKGNGSKFSLLLLTAKVLALLNTCTVGQEFLVAQLKEEISKLPSDATHKRECKSYPLPIPLLATISTA